MNIKLNESSSLVANNCQPTIHDIANYSSVFTRHYFGFNFFPRIISSVRLRRSRVVQYFIRHYIRSELCSALLFESALNLIYSTAITVQTRHSSDVCLTPRSLSNWCTLSMKKGCKGCEDFALGTNNTTRIGIGHICYTNSSDPIVIAFRRHRYSITRSIIRKPEILLFWANSQTRDLPNKLDSQVSKWVNCWIRTSLVIVPPLPNRLWSRQIVRHCFDCNSILGTQRLFSDIFFLFGLY